MEIKFDDRIYTGSPEEIVTEMNKTTHIPRENIYEYMQDFSYREFQWDGEGIRYFTPEMFLEELNRKGVLKIIRRKGE